MAGRIALVTGGNRGIGRSIVLSLARNGVSSIFTYRSHADEAEAVVKEVGAVHGSNAVARAIQHDVTDFASYDKLLSEVKSTLSTWGKDKLDIVIPSAGMSYDAPISAIKAEELDAVHAVHFKAPLLLIQAVLPIMNDGESSVIITISSGLARFSVGNKAVYGGIKGAIEIATRYLAKEVGTRGIRAVTARVGVVASDFGGGMVRDTKAIQDHLKGTIALGRIATPDDIGPAIAALAAPEVAWITGTTIELSGGQGL